jgi:hypothetical protein
MDKKYNMKPLIEVPLGTRIWINNGAWYGRICGTLENKKIYVEQTQETHELEKDDKADYTIVD